ncbi:hypothetical protein [Bosea sp. NPDC055594]
MIDELIERVEKGEGADRELDGAIHVALFPDSAASRFITGAYRSEWWKFGTPQGLVYRTENGGGLPLPSYTTSLDAVIALIEEKLPGWHADVDFGASLAEDGTLGARLFRPLCNPPGNFTGDAKSPARAALSAFLKAHKEQHDAAR